MTDSNGDLVEQVARKLAASKGQRWWCGVGERYPHIAEVWKGDHTESAKLAIAAVLDDLQNSAMNSTFAFDLIDAKRKELGL